MRNQSDCIGMFLNDLKTKTNLSNAELIEVTGLSSSSFYDYVKYEREPTIQNVLKIKKSVNISCDKLLTWDVISQIEKETILEKIASQLPELRFKYFLKSNLSNFYKDKKIPSFAKEEIYNYVKDLYYEEKRKAETV